MNYLFALIQAFLLLYSGFIKFYKHVAMLCSLGTVILYCHDILKMADQRLKFMLFHLWVLFKTVPLFI